MAIEDIFRALEEQAAEECRQIEDVARKQAAATVAEAREAALHLLEQKVQAAEAAAQRLVAKTLDAARVESMRRLGMARETAIDDVYRDASDRLAGLRSTTDYGRVFESLADEALAGTGGERVLAVDPADRDRAMAYAGADGTLSVATDLSSSGGVEVRLDEGRVVRRNTFESRLEKLRGFGDARIAEILDR